MNLQLLHAVGGPGLKLKAALESAFARVPVALYSVMVTDDPATPDGLSVCIGSADASDEYAQISFHVSGRSNVIYVTIGRDLDVEIPLDSGWRPTESATFELEIAALCDAVVSGRVRESNWIEGQETIRSEGVVILSDGRKIQVRHVHPSRRVTGKSRRVDRIYKPY